MKQKTEESSSGEEEEESEEEESEEESESPKRSMKVVNEAAAKTTATVALEKSPQLRKRLQKEGTIYNSSMKKIINFRSDK